MASIRTRLAVAYAVALGGTMGVFGGTVWAAHGAAGYRELQRYVAEEAEVAGKLLERASGPGLPLTVVEDPLVGPQAVDRVRILLDALPNIVIVTDASGRIVYTSLEARLLAVGEPAVVDSIAARLGPHTAGRVVIDRDTIGTSADYVRAKRLAPSEEVLVVRRDLPPELAPLRRVVVATPTTSTAQARRELVEVMLAVAPLVLLLSAGIGWVLASRAARPVERLINDMEAITDGRSLHRRLAVGGEDEAHGDELARLGATLNAMIGRLETSFGALRRFTADASHELKTPLTVLRATIERAMSAPPHSPEQLVALEEALQEVTRMAALVDSLLTLARFDEGRFDLYREPIALEPLVRDVYETAVILGEAGGLEIRLTALEPATVMGDATRLRQLFLNLVTNAIKYTPTGGSVEIALQVTEGAPPGNAPGAVAGASGVAVPTVSPRVAPSAVFTVRDTGIGIAAADLPYIFDRFWRADRARSRRPVPNARDAAAGRDTPGLVERGGFGLGLAISQWIAQAHGGTIAVVSRLTRGTTFTVTLPVREFPDDVPPLSRESARELPGSAAAERSGERGVLIES